MLHLPSKKSAMIDYQARVHVEKTNVPLSIQERMDLSRIIRGQECRNFLPN